MAEHAVQLSPAELSATTLIRVATEREVELLHLWQKAYPGSTQPAGLTCPYEVGDVLFHQEKWRTLTKPVLSMIPDGKGGHLGYAVLVQYRALEEPDQDGNDRYWCECPASYKDAPAYASPGVGKSGPWQPADTMPCWASRHRRTVTIVELVRLQEIPWHQLHKAGFPHSPLKVKDWDAANPAHPWASNPWVWVIGVENAP